MQANQEFFFTFGLDHPTNSNKYVRVIAPDSGKARSIMFANYGIKWAFQYDAAQFEGQPERWGITELASHEWTPSTEEA